MKVLVLESSGLVASVAIVTEEAVLAEYTVNYKKTHSQTLLPMLDEIVRMVNLDLADVDAVAVSAGPGSFTGLRIGSATAKGLGLALDKPILEIPTLEGMAFSLFGTDRLICPMMDARRNQVYTGLYEFVGSKFATVKEQTATAVENIIEEINQIGRNVVFIGDGADAYKAVIEKSVTVDYVFAPVHLNRQRAAAVGALGLIYLRENKTVSAKEHAPVYLRLSQAERERAEREHTEHR